MLAGGLLSRGLTRVIHLIGEILEILLDGETEQLAFFQVIVAHMFLVLGKHMLALLGTGNTETTVRRILLGLEELPRTHGDLCALVVGVAVVEILTIEDLIRVGSDHMRTHVPLGVLVLREPLRVTRVERVGHLRRYSAVRVQHRKNSV